MSRLVDEIQERIQKNYIDIAVHCDGYLDMLTKEDGSYDEDKVNELLELSNYVFKEDFKGDATVVSACANYLMMIYREAKAEKDLYEHYPEDFREGYEMDSIDCMDGVTDKGWLKMAESVMHDYMRHIPVDCKYMPTLPREGYTAEEQAGYWLLVKGTDAASERSFFHYRHGAEVTLQNEQDTDRVKEILERNTDDSRDEQGEER